MKSDKGRVKWCLKQKRGIRLDDPNSELCKEYLKKARGSINMLVAAIEKEEDEWAATIAYYARYYAVYALFLRCGIISEIHDCTIAAFGYLFVGNGIIKKELYEELVASKNSRIDAQYYVTEELEEISNEEADKVRAFVLAIEEVLDKLSDDKIKEVRGKLEN